MKSQIIMMALVLVIGIGIGVYLSEDDETPRLTTGQNTTIEPGVSAVFNSETVDIDGLRTLLQNEVKARQALEQTVESLSQQVAALDDRPRAKIDELHNDTQSTEANEDWFNEQALVDSGMSASQASELRVFYEQQELQQLYLRDQAIREGWDRQQYREEIQALYDQEDALEDRLGEDAFDAYLYASGQSNRVSVSSVLATAPAGEAGIQAGDHILRYDNQRIYSGVELRQATTAGDSDNSVPVQVERDGQIMEFYVLRGPLGIRMNSISVAP